MLGPTCFGSIYSWSLKNVKGIAGNDDALGFPLNQYFAFFVVGILTLCINVVPAWKMPAVYNNKIKSINDSSENKFINENDTLTDPDDEKDLIKATVTDITIGYFNPVFTKDFYETL